MNKETLIAIWNFVLGMGLIIFAGFTLNSNALLGLKLKDISAVILVILGIYFMLKPMWKLKGGEY